MHLLQNVMSSSLAEATPYHKVSWKLDLFFRNTADKQTDKQTKNTNQNNNLLIPVNIQTPIQSDRLSWYILGPRNEHNQISCMLAELCEQITPCKQIITLTVP